ncbi:MAG: bis(5'-nucleosyl)-tetraphosphatase (symmetrical) YqeK, partial [Elusimicrobia bacterium]|nr:bis(5'-nucleosyl)-tetraphosphatase (symmetrical) YqeK [Elusimicrobiota bacterium]
MAETMRARPRARAVVLPAWRSPLKGLPSASAADRLAMTRAALAGLGPALSRRVSLDAWELGRRKASYTVETLSRLRRLRPSDTLLFLAGADSWNTMPRWRRPAELARLAGFLVGRRPGSPPPRPGRGLPALEVLPGTFPDVSSTRLRAELLCGLEPAEAAPGALALVRAKRLYGHALRDRLSRELSPERFAHTLAVAHMAVRLALRHGLDPERAALAGLLHDCGRAVPASGMGAYARRRRLGVAALGETAERAPLLLHAHISEHRARRVYGVDDPAVLSAVRKHTLADAVMGPLDRLLYTADACSQDRAFAGAAGIRRAAFRDLAGAYREALRGKLGFVRREDAWMHPGAAAAW